MQVKWTSEALLQLAEIKGYIAKDKPEAARRVAAQLWSSVEQLADFPRLGKPGPVQALRILTIPPYTVTYRLRRDYVEVITVWDSRRKPRKKP